MDTNKTEMDGMIAFQLRISPYMRKAIRVAAAEKDLSIKDWCLEAFVEKLGKKESD